MKNIETILQVRLGEEYFGIDSDISNQILRVPLITSIPLSSKYLRGIVVLGGKIVPVLDLKTILNSGEVNIEQDTSRIITLHINEEEIAILVDEVIDALNIDLANYEDNISNDEEIVGFYKYDDFLIQILGILNIINSDMLVQFNPIEVEKLTKEDEEKSILVSDMKRYLFFRSQKEYFAINIELVAELIFVPNEIIPIAGSENVSLGAITLREEVIDVVDFNLLFGFEAVNLIKNDTRLLILRSEDKKVALCVEKVEEIKDIELSKVEPFNSSMGEGKLESIYKGEEHIISIVSNLYLQEIIEEFCISITKDETKQKDKREEMKNMRELAVFAIENEEFAFDIEGVQEIITYQEVTPLPESNEYVDGVINLRGSIIPVVNLPKKIGFQSIVTDKSKIVVCNIEDEKVGFLVDDVNDIMFIEDRYVSLSKNKEGMICSTISLDEGKRVILELRFDKIISLEDIQNIKESE